MARPGTLTHAVSERLRAGIREGKWVGDKPLPSERALAAEFEISRVTARRCLQMLCREGVVVARPGRGYFAAYVTAGPETLRHRRSILYYYASDAGTPMLDSLHATIINGANAESLRLGLHLYAVSKPPTEFLNALREQWEEGLRGVLLDWATAPVAERLIERGVPFVVVEDDIEGLPVCAVIQDNVGGTHQALEHMFERGHRHFGIIVNNRDEIHTQQRLAAYREFLLRHELPSTPSWLAVRPEGAAGGREAMAALLDADDPPTAVFVASRGLLPGALDELARRGRRYPEDVSLVVWGDPRVDAAHVHSAPVTYVTWSGEEMGRLAVRALEDAARRGRPERMVIRIATRLVDRGSVAMRAFKDNGG